MGKTYAEVMERTGQRSVKLVKNFYDHVTTEEDLMASILHDKTDEEMEEE